MAAPFEMRSAIGSLSISRYKEGAANALYYLLEVCSIWAAGWREPFIVF
jgi:hypothetical protein